ncbi:MAG: hypothetical protein AAFO94_08365, partial [Bacteroidota bacterium]
HRENEKDNSAPRPERQPLRDDELYLKAEQLTSDADVSVRMAAIAYLVEHTTVRHQDVLDRHLENPDAEWSGTVLVHLAKALQNNPRLKKKFKMRQRLEKRLDQLAGIPAGRRRFLQKIYIIKAIGTARIESMYPTLSGFFTDDNPAVVRQALWAAGKTRAPYFVPTLLRFMDQPAFSRMAKKSLEKYGRKLIPVLRELYRQQVDESQLIRKLPAAIKRVGDPKGISLLFDLLQYPNAAVRQQSLEVLSDLHFQHPDWRFRKSKVSMEILDEVLRYQRTLGMWCAQRNAAAMEEGRVREARQRVVQLLHKKLRSQLDNIFYLLSLRYSREHLTVILKGLKSRKPKLKLTALEFLDNLLDLRLKRVLIPLFEVSLLRKATTKGLRQLDIPVPDAYSCLRDQLNSGRELRLKIATLHLIGELRDERYLPLVDDCLQYNDPELRLFAENIRSILIPRLIAHTGDAA